MDPIDRQLAINECYPVTVDGEVYEVVQVETLMGLPSAQPEIIRCKDCRWFAGEGMYCTNNILTQFDHFFCYYGERKEDKK